MRDIAHEQIAAGGSAGHWGMRVLRLARTVLVYAAIAILGWCLLSVLMVDDGEEYRSQACDCTSQGQRCKEQPSLQASRKGGVDYR